MTLLVDFYVQSASEIPPPLNLVLSWPKWLYSLYRICRRGLASQGDKAFDDKNDGGAADRAHAGAGRVPLGQGHHDETRAYRAYLQQREEEEDFGLDERVIQVLRHAKVCNCQERVQESRRLAQAARR